MTYVQEGHSVLGTSQPHPARIYDCLLGGKDHCSADEEVAAELSRRWPEIPLGVRENRSWMHRVVRHLARDEGVDQFLDIGSGIPTSPNLHEVAQPEVPGARVLYADNDPVVLSHAEALLTPVTPDGRTHYLDADLRDPAALLSSPVLRETFDMDRPVALTLVAVLHFLEDHEDPYGVVSTLVDALPSGSFLALSHACGDAAPASAAEAAAFYRERKVSAPVVPRSAEAIEAFFTRAGVTLLPPGVVSVARWQEDPASPGSDGVWFYGGVGRKP